MKVMGWTLLGLLLIVSMFIITGCAPAIYSQQNYGSMPAKYSKVKVGDSEADVLMQLGPPDAVYVGDDVKALVYTFGEGLSVVMGIYTKAERTDTVVVLGKDNKVVGVERIARGEGSTILGPAETMPLPVAGGWVGIFNEAQLFKAPQNYSLEKEK